MRKEFDNVGQMQKWLTEATGVAIIAVGLQSNFASLYSNITSPSQLASAVAAQHTYAPFCSPNHFCFLEYDDETGNDKTGQATYEDFMGIFRVRAPLTGVDHNRRDKAAHIFSEIGDREYMVRSQDQGDGFALDVILVRMPMLPSEVFELRDTLLRHSVMVVVPDGSHQIHLGNTYWGTGITPV